MKQKFSTSWKSSKQVRKKRKYAANAPLHVKRKFLASTLSKELRQKHKMRNIELRKSDEVKVMRGRYKGKTGKISVVDTKKTRVGIEGIQRSKLDGTKINIWFHPSNLKITSLNLDDKKRIKSKEKENAHEKK